MNRLSGHSRWSFVATAFAMAGCLVACAGTVRSGDEPAGDNDNDNGGGAGGKGGTSTGGKGGSALPPPSANSLKRIPDHELKCDKPGALNVAPTPFGRLTNVQYANAIADLIAPLTIDPAMTKLKAEQIFNGFTTYANSQSTVAEVIESFEKVGVTVGDTVAAGLDKVSAQLKIAGSCPPKTDAVKAACATAFIDAFGSKAFRRPLEDDEKARYKKLFDDSAAKWTFEDGISVVASAIAQAPQFLYKIEVGGTKVPEGFKLSPWEVAARLSFLIWNTLPDDALVEAAKSGTLNDVDGINAQATRLLADSKRSQAAAKEFVTQWYDAGKLGNGLGSKDVTRFKSYSTMVAKGLVDGLDAFVADTLTGPNGSLQKFFTSTDGWVNKDTASIYGVSPAPTGTAVTKVALNKSQRQGFLTQPALLAGLAHGYFQSPVERGVFVLTQLMCQPPPAPPAGVDRSLFDQPAAAKTETYREATARILASQPATCQSCHNIINPVGYMFENYDALGQWQEQENTRPVDASGKIAGSYDIDGNYKNGLEFAGKVATSEQVQQCFVQGYFRYNLGRDITDQDGCEIASITDQVINSKGSFQNMVLSLAKSNAFRYRSPIAQ